MLPTAARKHLRGGSQVKNAGRAPNTLSVTSVGRGGPQTPRWRFHHRHHQPGDEDEDHLFILRLLLELKILSLGGGVASSLGHWDFLFLLYPPPIGAEQRSIVFFHNMSRGRLWGGVTLTKARQFGALRQPPLPLLLWAVLFLQSPVGWGGALRSLPYLLYKAAPPSHPTFSSPPHSRNPSPTCPRSPLAPSAPGAAWGP